MTDFPICLMCGMKHISRQFPDKASCNGHTTDQDGTRHPCRKLPSAGTTVCRKHGATAPQTKAAAQRRIEKDKAARLAARVLGTSPTQIDAITALHMQICWAQTHVDWYRAQVQRLVPDALVWGETEIRDADMQGLTVIQRSEANMWLRLYNEERERLVNWSTRAVAAGLAEREVRIGEQLGAQLAQVIRLVLSDLKLTEEQVEAAAKVVPKRLRAISGGAS
jgi:hypothetical protein